MTTEPILTLEARDNILLEMLQDDYGVTDSSLRSEISRMHQTTIDALADKGISYSALKPALVPQSDKNEAGFLFDTMQITDSWYGRPVMERVLPLLDPRTTQSVLYGDLMGKNQPRIRTIVLDALVPANPFTYVHSSALFCVYLNNLSDAALGKIHSELSAFPAYIGHIPATFSTPAKTYLSTTVGTAFVKSGTRVLMPHPDDVPNTRNENALSYPFESFGYTVASIQTAYFRVLLTYKIERAVFPGFEGDGAMALQAISDTVVPLQNMTVLLEESKHDYLLSAKAGKMRKAGIEAAGRAGIEALIRAKVNASYIYNLMYLDEHNVAKFNLMIEVDRSDGGYPTRVTSALEYRPSDSILRVITLC